MVSSRLHPNIFVFVVVTCGSTHLLCVIGLMKTGKGDFPRCEAKDPISTNLRLHTARERANPRAEFDARFNGRFSSVPRLLAPPRWIRHADTVRKHKGKGQSEVCRLKLVQQILYRYTKRLRGSAVSAVPLLWCTLQCLPLQKRAVR